MNRVFITRSLPDDSLFRQLLTAAGWEVAGFSLIRFRPAPFAHVPAADWLFFYSKKAVQFFFAGLLESGRSLSPAARLAALGPGTAAAIKAQGREVAFTGDGDPDHAADAFLPLARRQRVLFPRAANSRRSVQKRLAGHVESIELIVYRNEARTDRPPPPAEVLVFTSPLNAQAFFAIKPPGPDQRIIAIGRTTAAALQELGAREVAIAEAPNETALAQQVLALSP